MSYRSGPCSFCDGEAREQCPRCGAAVCATHAPASNVAERPAAVDRAISAICAICAICAKELKDDLDELKFVRDLKQPGEDRGMFTRRRVTSFSDALDSVSDYVMRALDARRARKTFERRTSADIAAWRRRAGITVRGS